MHLSFFLCSPSIISISFSFFLTYVILTYVSCFFFLFCFLFSCYFRSCTHKWNGSIFCSVLEWNTTLVVHLSYVSWNYELYKHTNGWLVVTYVTETMVVKIPFLSSPYFVTDHCHYRRHPLSSHSRCPLNRHRRLFVILSHLFILPLSFQSSLHVKYFLSLSPLISLTHSLFHSLSIGKCSMHSWTVLPSRSSSRTLALRGGHL